MNHLESIITTHVSTLQLAMDNSLFFLIPLQMNLKIDL